MKRIVLAAAFAVLVLGGCGTDSSNTAGETSQQTPEAAVSAATTAPTAAPAPATPQSVATAARPPEPASASNTAESAAARTPPLVVPELPTEPGAELGLPEPGADMPHGEELYAETCNRFVAVIDALAASGAATRQESVAGMAAQMQANASWPTLSTEDQQTILRGLDAAGGGSC
ncbi:hypothetical protein [Rhodococcoides yunnanense]|uniref:hypothetical protein n=1 Tax=Rhodococcoides yunnanense TaxID=278209 RepID=UPI0009345E70|nr:hypothetical protein [Rhodococcus yunnanensis]